ncbi:PP2C family protein-serine/threonine phosphatase [Streptomyces sp. B93]|uniref:PP2C family protein-serine/threonine phosphatase n=1 Tax=Streptomyces sp. B93 TaxID=2824875 RepID=UPI001B3669FA|nr:PP2C family protein-serine/threonine phosphatase [Streptomyces sp. B93]MBQ1090351.1 serine/threonine-protein phosphatase [Streptomyces sp. B93]
MSRGERRLADLGQPWPPSHVLLPITLMLIGLITALDIVSTTKIVLGPLLVIAPALIAWSEGPWVTGGVGALAVGAQALIGWNSGLLFSRALIMQLVALTVLSCLVVLLCVVRDRSARRLAQVRSVAEAAQHVLLWPLPGTLGPLQLASLYLAAEDEAEIGGDLYAAARTDHATRVMIGDVRGKGLPAIGEAALLLGAFREAAHQHSSLPELAAALERSVVRYLADFEPVEETGERFVTALLLEIPDDDPVIRMTSCGHPAPLLLRPGSAVAVPDLTPAPPLGLGLSASGLYTLDAVPFGAGDTLLLYTDGAIEARDRDGAFYPFKKRAAQWTGCSPKVLLRHIQRDLLAHTGGRLGDDAALIAIRRTPASRPSDHGPRADTTRAA